MPAVKAAEVIDSLLGAGEARVAIDERSNSLIVAGKGESLTMIEAPLMRLDEQANADPQPTADPAHGGELRWRTERSG